MRFDEKYLCSVLSKIGYKRLKRFVYTALWNNSEVEHFLYFSTWGTPKEFFTGDFGLRNREADQFAIECLLTYGGKIFHLVPMRHDPRMDCTMRFPIGKLANWSPRWSLHIASMPTDILAERVKTDIEQRMFPAIRNVTTLDALLILLSEDAEPCRWLHVNGAVRAAQIAYLGRKLGWEAADIRNILRPFAMKIGSGIDKTEDPVTFIERIIARAVGNGGDHSEW